MLQQLAGKVELEAQAVTIEDGSPYPKGYLDGMLWAFDLVLMWINEMSTK